MATCVVDLGDVGSAGASAKLVDACSCPSQEVNSDPSDCIVTAKCTTDAQCNDDNICTVDICDQTTGLCLHPANTGASCGDQIDTVCDNPDSCSSLGFCTNNNNEPATTTCRDAAGVCDVAEKCDGAGSCPTDAKQSDGTFCGFVTDSSLCTFDMDEKIAGKQFRVVFTPDAQIWPGYKLNASNPGQFYYNAIINGTRGTPASTTLKIPWPFVTQGAMPVHVYDAEDIHVNGCFRDSDGNMPTAGFASYPATIMPEDWATGGLVRSGDGFDVTCDKVLFQPGQFPNGRPPQRSPPYECSVTVQFTMPESGQAYVNIHLDYGVKGTQTDANPIDGTRDRYAKGLPPVAPEPLCGSYSDALAGNVVALATCTTYGFSHTATIGASPPVAGGDSVQNINEFKKIAGGFGRVGRSDDGSGFPGVTATLIRQSTRKVVATGVTDEDGYYALPYKHTGKREWFLVVLGQGSSAVSTLVELKANGWVEVSYDATTRTWFIDSVGK